MNRPGWARRFGYDRFGVWADFVVAEVEFRLRWIPPGVLWMGSPQAEEGHYKDESPRHEVSVTTGYWLADTPTTQAQWQAVMGDGSNPSDFSSGDEAAERPVENVSWDSCQKFCQRLSSLVDDPHLKFTLPSEAQWEYACRGGTDSAFSDGSHCTAPSGADPALEALGWYRRNSGETTHPVKQKAANAWGLFDLHGNVWEWCQDKRREYTPDMQIDPFESPGESAERAVRGGSWSGSSQLCRSACRFWFPRVYRDQDVGLRLAAGQPAEPGVASGGGATSGGAARDRAERGDRKSSSQDRVYKWQVT